MRRWLDAWAGRRDGLRNALSAGAQDVKHGLVAEVATWPGGSPHGTVWLARNCALFRERDRHDYLVMLRCTASDTVRLRTLESSLAPASDALQRARSARAQVSADLTEPEMSARSVAEVHDNILTVRTRRRREHARRLRTLDAAVVAEEAQVRGLLEGLMLLRAGLNLQFESAVVRNDRLREFYNRRAGTYLRAYWRAMVSRHPNPTVFPPFSGWEIPAPEWTRRPSPWAQQPDEAFGDRLGWKGPDV
jgi:hypothetical protein